jgi:phenylpyruvate tautomerase PptA (4-oxalocrotonate tautomerase family)
MSTQVLLALAEPELFKGMSDEEIDRVTEALVAEISGDAQLKQRLAAAVSRSAAEIMDRKTSTAARPGS